MQCGRNRTADSHHGRHSRHCHRGIRRPPASRYRYRVGPGHDCTPDGGNRVLSALDSFRDEYLSDRNAAKTVARNGPRHADISATVGSFSQGAEQHLMQPRVPADNCRLLGPTLQSARPGMPHACHFSSPTASLRACQRIRFISPVHGRLWHEPRF